MMPPSTTGPAALLGQIVGGRYRLLRLLGEGGMGAVFEAEQLDLARRVAVKMLRRRFGAAELARFRREAEATARLAHPHIVTIIDFVGGEAEPPAIVMELLPGTSVRSEIERLRRLPPARAIAIATQVLSALAAAHAAGVVHRDVKPANVLLVAAGPGPDFAKVLDFGVAKVEDGTPLSENGEVLGTPAYMAPEQVTAGPVDARTDVYGVGALLYAMLCGIAPIDTRRGIATVVVEAPRDVRSIEPTVPPDVAAVVHRALEKNPAARFPSAAEMARALAACVSSPAPSAPPPTPATLSAPPAPTGGSHPRTLESPAVPALATPPPTPPLGPSGPPVASSPAAHHANTPAPSGGGRGGTAASPAYPMPMPAPPRPPPEVTVEPVRYAPAAPARASSPLVPILIGIIALLVLGGGAAAALAL